MTIYAITESGYRVISSESDLSEGEVISESIPDSLSYRIKCDSVRAERDNRLRVCDWTQLTDVSSTLNVEKWIEYRQELRDITNLPDFPNVQWPIPPE